ncbi:MAG: class I SAM-dependent methyltransferase [Tepidisphaeraceae bacterium]
MSFWDARFGEEGFAYGTEPNEFLVSQASLIPRGRVLCLAEGEGRNAVFLAQRGYAVHAIDISPVGLEKAKKLAESRGVTITTEVADLTQRPLERDHWSGIVSIWAHMPADVRAILHRQIAGALVPGGVFVLEAYAPRQLAMPGRGGPKEQPGMFMPLAALRQELSDLDIVHATEIDREVNEGKYHSGLSAVTQFVGRRPM